MIIKYDHSQIKPGTIRDIVIHHDKVIVTLYEQEPMIFRKVVDINENGAEE